MDEPIHEFSCPVCGLAVPRWREVLCFFHHYFHENRAKHKTYEELVRAFFEEPPDMKGESK
jgi:hypothetical protein